MREGRVFGEVMTFPDIEKTLARLDRLEGYRPGGESHYIRVERIVTVLNGKIAQAWIYVYPKERPIYTDFIQVHSGCWREHLSSSPTL